MMATAAERAVALATKIHTAEVGTPGKCGIGDGCGGLLDGLLKSKVDHRMVKRKVIMMSKKIKLIIVAVTLLFLMATGTAFAGGVFLGTSGTSYFLDTEPGDRVDISCHGGAIKTMHFNEGSYSVSQCVSRTGK